MRPFAVCTAATVHILFAGDAADNGVQTEYRRGQQNRQQ